METADFRGLACPLPVVRCRDLLRAGAKDLRLLVDNEPAVDNVSRFLRGQGFAVSVAQEGPACWSLTASADEAAGQPPAAPEARPAASAAKNGPRTLALITTPTLGRGDDGLGAKLMTNFLTTLPELGSHLWRVILINGGVTLAATPGPALEALQRLAADGVSVLVCGTCLTHYGLLEAKAVGETSNMLDIVTSLYLADYIIRP